MKSNPFLFYDRRKIKTSLCFQRFGIKSLSRAALQTTAEGSFPLNEWTTDVIVSNNRKVLPLNPSFDRRQVGLGHLSLCFVCYSASKVYLLKIRSSYYSY